MLYRQIDKTDTVVSNSAYYESAQNPLQSISIHFIFLNF